MNVLVIGAGVLGLSAAHHVALEGHSVTLVDSRGAYAGASSRSFAWINANHKLPKSYYNLNRAGIDAHKEFQAKHSELGEWFHQQGCILVDSSPSLSDQLQEREQEAQRLGYEVKRIDKARLQEFEPSVQWQSNEALFFPLEAHLDNLYFGEVLEQLLRDQGIEIRQATVNRILSCPSEAVVMFEESTPESFDQVVVAAGAESRYVAERSGMVLPVAELGEPEERTHSFLGVTEPTDVDLQRVIISDRINVRPRKDGSMFVQLPPLEYRTQDGNRPEVLSAIKEAMEAELARFFGEKIPMKSVVLSGRSFPEDGISIVGYLDSERRTYALVTHSGMTLAPLLGILVAEELGGNDNPLLRDFRPSRFQNGVKEITPGSFIGRQ